MQYLLDGYNILFALEDSSLPLQKRRDQLILFLQTEFAAAHLRGILVFDNAQNIHSHAYPSPLQIAYAPPKMGADAYLLELVEGARLPAQITVITNDQGLARKARALGAHTASVATLMRLFKRKHTDSEVKPQSMSQYELERLRKLFEGG